MSEMSSLTPFDLFNNWINQAEQAGEKSPYTVALSTVNEMGQPSVRMVEILPGDVQRGVFSFCTHMESRKAYDMFRNPHVALCFHWKTIQRCVRVEGVAYTLDDAAVDTCFSSYPTAQQLALWVSRPFSVLEEPSILHEKLAHYATMYGDQPVPRPPNWGGFCIQPTQMEFWQEDGFYLHANQLFELQPEGWKHQWLYP